MSSSAVDPILRIGTLDDAMPRRNRFFTAPVSLVVHLGAVTALILVPIFGSADLPQPTSSVRAFLVEPPAIGAPPPPPPPPALAAAARTAPRPAAPAAFVAPIETPDTIAAEPTLDLGLEGGAPGGVEGGVAGGVVGGIVGGLPEAPPPVHAPVRVGGQIKEPRKLKDVTPVYPPLAADARVKGTVILEAVLQPDGRVGNVKVLRSIPLLDEAAVTAVRQWVYTPTFLDGVPVPVIMTVTVTFNLHN